MNVTEITPDDDDYDSYLNEAINLSEKCVGLEYKKILDITLIRNGEEIEPTDTVAVNIRIKKNLDNVNVIHFEDEPKLIPAEVNGKNINFETDSFSAYAIVSGPDAVDIGLEKVLSLDDLTSPNGFFISHTGGYFFRNITYNPTSGRTGILKTALSDNPKTAASKYYFTDAGGGKYYIHTFDVDGHIKYLRNNSNNSLTFSNTPVTKFTVEMDENNQVVIHNGSWFCNMQGGEKGKGFCAYNTVGDPNNNMYLWAYDLEDDPYGLDGQSYGLMRYNSGTSGKAMMNEVDNGALVANLMQVLTKETDHADKIYIPAGSDIPMWTFDWIEADKYAVSCEGQYIDIVDGEIVLTNTPVPLTVSVGNSSITSRISLSKNGQPIRYSGHLHDGFIVDGSAKDSWLYLVSEAPVSPDYLMTYTANKVSISDTEKVTNGSKVIVYTRVWNDHTKKYELYAIDHDGALVPCSDTGDTIEWIGSAINTLLWDFTEYYYEGTTNPNYYYELQNTYSGKYIAPQRTDNQILSDEPIGINIQGRRYGEYYSTIMAWDDPYYSYAALYVDGDELISSPLTRVSDFYFAKIDIIDDDDALTTVNTLDGTQYGITMKLVNFDSNAIQNSVLGSSAGGANVPPTQGLLSTSLNAQGYPVAVKTNRSMEELFGQAEEVNHLFLESTYNTSGYFEFDSTQNFATIQDNGDFKLYKQIGTTDASKRPSLQHGQFFPFNDLEEGHFAQANDQNMYSATLEELPETDPRKYEQLYKVDTPDYYFGLQIEASFVQTPSGLDAWGHDIIYEFTGDDDFWLYVDGQLVIDLGGIHSALPGNVNFSTGIVNVNGKQTTLYNIFKSNYKKEHPDATDAEVNAYLDGIFELSEGGKYLFKDYTSHDMKIFFMERGAGASNLHTKFNLSAVKKGQIVLNKQISGTENPDYRLCDYGYQIYYQLVEGDPYQLLDITDEHSNITVKYQNTNTPVKFRRTYTPVGSTTTYNNVFFLNPKQTVTINVPDETIHYKIVEVGVNSQVYDQVKINDEVVVGTPAGTNRMDFTTAPARVYERPRVVYDNHVSENAERTLTITKRLVDIDGNQIHDDPTGFNFRLYLGTENDTEPTVANTQDYYVKNPNGEYCTWDIAHQCFATTGKTEFSELTAEQKAAATFQTSPNGAISKIPADYKVEVRGLLIGTIFKVEERTNEIPEGYSFVEYQREGTSYIIHGDTVNTGTIRANESPAVEVVNRRGFGLSMKKEWSDASYTMGHEDTFFAVYVGDALINGSVRRNVSNKLYWYFDELASGFDLEDYEIKEVKLSGDYAVDGETVTGNYTVTPLENGDPITLDATLKEGGTGTYVYTVTYTTGTPVGHTLNARTDIVTNSRHGIRLIKEDFEGHPLANAVFTIKDPNGNMVGDDSYKSNAQGLITIAYLNVGEVYTLTETTSPRSYLGIQNPIKFRLNNDGTITVTEGDQDYYSVTPAVNGEMAQITVKDRPFVLKAVKQSPEGRPLSGAVFQLYKEVTIGGTPTIDFYPMLGYEHLTTWSDGTIPSVDESLQPGSYYLREVSPPNGYGYISGNIRFTISQTGAVTVDEMPEAELTSNLEDGQMIYTIEITDPIAQPLPTGHVLGRTLLWLAVLILLYLGLKRRSVQIIK